MTTEIEPYHQPELTIRQADSDEKLIAMWLFDRPDTTKREYKREVDAFIAFVQISLRQVTLSTMQEWVQSLEDRKLSTASRSRCIATIKSLFTFGQKLGYLTFNVAAVLRNPKQKDVLAQRILSEADVHRMLALEPNRRNAIILKLLYAAGCRVDELTGLTWADCQPNGDAGQITVCGKGGKTRAIKLPVSIWQDLISLMDTDLKPDLPVFRSRKENGRLDNSMICRIVRAAAVRAGIKAPVSPHWLRHAHASHALDRGAPISLVQATLGHKSVATTGRYTHARPGDSSARFLSL